jgi:hypothetical protein
MTSIAASRPNKDNAVSGVVGELQTKFGGRVVTSLTVREQHGNTSPGLKPSRRMQSSFHIRLRRCQTS